MSISTKSRLFKNPPNRSFGESTYRQALPFLLKDSNGRCAYSMQHLNKVGGTIMEVDHFNPNLRGPGRNRYSNLMPATRHCNGHKLGVWPSPAGSRKGIRFLNPFKEEDYGKHIFEDPITHELVGITPAGRWQIRYCDLNAPHFILEREERTHLQDILNAFWVVTRSSLLQAEKQDLLEKTSGLRTILDLMIPPIPPPPSHGEPPPSDG